MITATILENQYEIRNQWSDVTIKQMAKAQEYIDNMPKWLSNYIYSEDDEPVSEGKLLKFYIDWIGLFSNIPKEYLEGEIAVNNTDELSLIELFGLVSKFLGEPSQEEIGESEVIKLGKKEYRLIESVKTTGGVSKMLGGATYKHFSESQALASLFQKKQYRKWSYLSKITAILFREEAEEQYEEELIEMRAKAFENLPVSEAYRGYFFLLSLQKKQQEHLVLSLTQRKKVKSSTPLVKRYYLAFIGRIKLIISHLKAFITNKG
jgi:hypothetical protein